MDVLLFALGALILFALIAVSFGADSRYDRYGELAIRFPGTVHH